MSFNIVNYPHHTYFITAKIEGGKHLFINKDFIFIILNSLDFLRKQKRIKLFAFVIMPNHLHFLAKPINKWTAKQVCTDFEKFTAHKIIQLLKEKKNISLLEYFGQQAKDLADRAHKVWQDIQGKNCYSEDFLRQKLEYIHNNPVNKGWELVKDRKDYAYSSACYYDSDLKVKPTIEVEYLWDYVFGK